MSGELTAAETPVPDSETGSATTPQVYGSTRHRANLESFLVNLLHDFLDTTDLDVVMLVSRLNRYLRQQVKTYLIRRYHVTIQPWIRDPLAFRTAMRKASAIIGGSVALKMILTEKWSAKNLNIYVPKDRTNDLIAYLIQHEGYEVSHFYTSEAILQPPSEVMGYAGRSFTRLYRADPSNQWVEIEIIESKDMFALSPIFQSNSTWGFNWLTADSVTSAYPILTMDRCGISRWRYKPLGQPAIYRWFLSYMRDRKFRDIAPSDWRIFRACGSECVSRTRSTSDQHCLTTFFGKERHRESYHIRAWAFIYSKNNLKCENSFCPNYQRSPWEARPQNFQLFWQASYY